MQITGRRYRRNVGFVLDVSRHSTKLDRNAKVRLLVAVEVMERRTKGKGRRNGLASIPGLLILRTLLLRFHGPTGLCCPSISTLQEATGLCRQTIVTALKRLQAVGVLVITRRLVRVRECGALVVRQGSNLYAFRELPAQVRLTSTGSLPEVGRRFPSPPRRDKPQIPDQTEPWMWGERGLPVREVSVDWRARARQNLSSTAILPRPQQNQQG